MALTKVTGQVIKNTTDVTVGVLTVTNTLAVGGTVSIGGTLTYEDVTNVDAVGLITARNGIVVGSGITLSKDGDIFATGITTISENLKVGTGVTISPDGDGFFTGVITATSYSGIDLSAVTGATDDFSIADKIVHTGDTNTAIRFPAADTITAETGGSERFRINSNGDVTTTGEAGFSRQNAGFTARSGDSVAITRASGTPLEINRTGSDGQMISFFDDNSQEASIALDSGSLTFGLPNSSSERFRINSDGNVLINTTATPTGYGNLNIFGTDNTGSRLAIRRGSADANGPQIWFNKSRNTTDGSHTVVQSGDILGSIVFTGNDSQGPEFSARIMCEVDGTPGSNDMPGRLVFSTTPDGSDTLVERLRIDSSGTVESNSSFSATYSSTSSITPHLRARNQNGSDNIYGGIQLRADRGNGAAAIFNIACLNSSTSYESALIFQSRNTDGNFTEKMRIIGNGDVLIGTDSYAYTKPLNVQGSTGAILSLSNYDTTTYAADTSTSIELRVNTGNTGNQNGSCEIRAFKENGTNGNNARALSFYTGGNGGSPAERYRIHSDGKQSWNNTTFPYGETFHFYNGLEGSCASFYQNSSNDHTNLILRHGRGLSGYNGYQMLFKRNDGTNVGSIISGASSTSFNTSSDYRLKENQITIPNAIDKLNKLKPYEFNFKDDPDYKHLGFFAHEVQEIIPNGVAYGEKDEVYTEDSPSESDDYKKGDMKIQSLDYGKLTPLLTAALQEAIIEIESLKAEVAALKSS